MTTLNAKIVRLSVRLYKQQCSQCHSDFGAPDVSGELELVNEIVGEDISKPPVPL